MNSLFEDMPSLVEGTRSKNSPEKLPQANGANHKTALEARADGCPPKILEDALRTVISPVTVKVYVRHGAECPKRNDKLWRHCTCPKWFYINNNGKDRRRSAKTRSWSCAEGIRKELEDSFDPVKAEKQRQRANHITIDDAIARYLDDVGARKLAPVTLRRCRLIFVKQLLPWCQRHGLHYLDDLKTSALTRFRFSSWATVAPITSQTRQHRLVNFFEFCSRQDWLQHNPARRLTPIKVKPRPTDYFTRPEFERLIEATYLAGETTRSKDEKFELRLRSLVLIMRWSGLRLGDAVRLERSQLVGDRVFLYQAKTGEPVSVLLPPETAKYLRHIPGNTGNARYFFCNNAGDVRTAVGRWSRALRRLFKLADIRKEDGTRKRCHAHMLRDTFAIEALLAGIPIDLVSILLGHTTIKTTLRHYSPWVRARQEQLDNMVKRAHRITGITKSASTDTARAVLLGSGRLPFDFDRAP
jgi:integrase/recombinase XerD